MKYCITAAERCGTCYHEFQRGKFGKFFWNKTQFWEEDSLLLHDDLMRSSGFGAFLGAQLPNYVPFGITYITQIQWQNLFLAAQQQGGAVAEIAGEIDSWALETFQSHTMFTILGM